jgi:hypothetical protein
MRVFTEPQRFWLDLVTILALAIALWAGRPAAVTRGGPTPPAAPR